MQTVIKQIRNLLITCVLTFGVIVFIGKLIYCNAYIEPISDIQPTSVDTNTIDIPMLLQSNTSSQIDTSSQIPTVSQSNSSVEDIPEISESEIITTNYQVIDTDSFEPVSNSYYDLSESDVYELATLVWLEGGAESDDCQKAIASAVLNRMTTRNATLQEIIYEENQFSPAYKISYTNPSEHTLQLVSDIVNYGPTLPEYVTYFRADYYHNWSSQIIPYCVYGDVYFSADTSLM